MQAPVAWGTPRVHPSSMPTPGGGVHDRLDMLESELSQMRSELGHHRATAVMETRFVAPPLALPQLQNHPHAHAHMYSTPPSKGQHPFATPSTVDTALMITDSSPSTNATNDQAEPVVSYKDYHFLHQMHKDLIIKMSELQNRHNALLNNHSQLMSAHADVLNMAADLHTKVLTAGGAAAPRAAPKKEDNRKKHPSLGIIRLDYNYPPAEGDVDCPASFGYDVIFRVVPGLTFEMAQQGKFTEAVERRFAEAIKFLEHKKVNAITGDCGFMMAFQVIARKIATAPVFMSSMVQCPIIAAAFDPKDKILILTANDLSLKPQKDVLLNSCGFDVDEGRFVIKGCQNVPGFDAVAKGEAVPIDIVQPGIVKTTMDTLRADYNIKAILLECTELPPYADALRAATELPVWDAITAADFYVSGYKDNPRFGIDDWQKEWDQEYEEYKFGDNLTLMDQSLLLQKDKQQPAPKAKAKAKAKTKAMVKKMKKIAAKAKAPVLGVIRLDYNYPPAAGDIDCPGSYDYDVLFRMVPGLTFEMAQSGRLSYTVQQQFVAAVKWLEAKGVCGITGDCGFMMAFQPLARDVANVPVFMSSMVQCPMVSVAFDKYDQILILTANSATLQPQKEILLSQCGFDVDDDRFIIVGCQDVPGFDAVAKGTKVDVEAVTPGIVKLVQGILEKQPNIRAIVSECTELPPYSDALRMTTGLPVWDAITCADYFVSCRKDNPRFGLNQWQNDWDGVVDEYKLGENLTAAQRGAAKYV